jgi:drug/metabolite transporter (DMT)-like permease
MNRIAGIIVLVVGIVLIGWGLNSNDSLGSRISRIFSDTPTDRTIYLVVGGALMAAVGASLTFYPRKSRA